VPLIGQIKDAQFAFAAFPEKRVKMTVLVADIPAAYGILLGRSFCSEVGGEIHMDWSKAKIPVKGVMQTLEPESQKKYLVTSSEDPKAQILFESSGMGNYFLSTEKDKTGVLIQEKDLNEIWTLQFDGSCATSGCGAGAVLISPEEE
ncbi:hypothetical protein KI387_002925, partial [Taxus chinensis]